MASASVVVDNLTCEYLENPLGIDVKHPRLSWVLKSGRRGEVQKAYQVLVATSEKSLQADKGDLWDSGKVDSDQSIFVSYNGKGLTSGMECYWKVRVWDKDGNPSDWSRTAFWSMGMLSPGDWKAEWIAYSKDWPGKDSEDKSQPTQQVPSPLFRRGFSVSKSVKNAYAYICGLGYYELRLNGSKVGDHVLDPGFTRYDKRALYVTYDVTKQLQQGENAVGVMLGNGWYNMHAGCEWNFNKASWRDTPRLLFRMDVEYQDGTRETIVSDGSWKTTTGSVVFDCIRNGETYDARLERPGWDLPGYSDSGWKPVEKVNGPAGRLIAQINPPIKVTKVFSPAKVTEVKPGVFVFDMGQNIAGWTRLKVSGPAGTAITIKYDERLDENGLVDQKNAVYSKTGKFQTDTYILKGEGTEVWEPRFVYHGFQYAEVEGFPGKPTVDNLQACVVHTDFDQTGTFQCSNDLLNKIQENTLWSYVGNFVGYPTDCPHREKNGWTGDAHLAAEMGLYNFNPQASYAKWMNDFKDEQRENGEFPGIIPTSDWGYGIGPAWDSAYILIPWYVYLYSGDKRILEEHYEGFKRYLDFLITKAEGHIVSYLLGDWCPPHGACDQYKSPTALTSTAYYYIDALTVSKIAVILGKKEDAKKYESLAGEIRKAFHEEFYMAEKGTYAGECQTSIATPLYQGLVPESDRSKVVASLLAEIDKCNGHLDCGILGTKYLLNVLTDNGRTDVAYKVATKTTFPSWGHWIEQGATTLWEAWQGDSSRNHIMFGDISAWFYRALAGINPDSDVPGFKHFIIRPCPVEDLKWAKGEYKTMYGTIRSSWKTEDGVFQLDVEVPVNTTASVYIECQSPDSVKEGGKPVSDCEGVKYLRMENGFALFETGAGTYSYTVDR